MGLDMKTKKAIIKEIAERYQRERKKEKKKILDGFVDLTGYCRCYASWLLRNSYRKIVMRVKRGERVVFIGELKKIKRQRKRIYDEEVLKVLERIWYIMDYP